MTFISRIQLKVENLTTDRIIQVLSGGGYKTHQHVWNLFNDNPEAVRDFLFRMEQSKGLPQGYVVSQREPYDSQGLWNIKTKVYTPVLKTNQTLAFTLRVNPTVTRTANDKQMRHDVVMDEKRRIGYKTLPPHKKPPISQVIHKAAVQWLVRRAEKSGFGINEASVIVESYRQHRLQAESEKEIQYSTVDFSGVLKIVDPEIFQRTLLRGIGPAKAFGCGLLLVRRI